MIHTSPTGASNCHLFCVFLPSRFKNEALEPAIETLRDMHEAEPRRASASKVEVRRREGGRAAAQAWRRERGGGATVRVRWRRGAGATA
jgi:hypothetical protein